MRFDDPFRVWMAGVRFGFLVVEAQTVIAYRTLGVMGLWATTESETHRMVSEKAPAFARAYFGAVRAVAAGRSGDQVIDAWTRPLRARTRRNVRRLGGRGPAR